MKLKYQTVLLTAALALASCDSDAPYPGSEGQTGKILLPGVEVSNAAKVVNSGADAGSRATYNVDPFIVDFYRDGETDPFRSKTYGEINGAEELPVGTYTLAIRSHDVKNAEWDAPYFIGRSAKFTIEDGQITEIDPVVCKFSSVKVSIVFGDKLKAQLGSDVQVEVKANTDGKLVYTPTETRDGYFAAVEGSTTLVATFSGTVNGNKESIVRTYADIAPGQHRVITYEIGGQLPVPPEQTGSFDFGGITIDETIVEEDLTGNVDPGKEEPLPDEEEPGKLPDIDDPNNPGKDPETPDQPTPPSDPITFTGNLENGQSYYSDGFNANKPANVIINVEKGCADIEVFIDSSFLTKDELQGVHLDDKFKLVNEPRAEILEGVAGLGLPCLDGGVNEDGVAYPAVRNQKSINFDISSFMELLAIGGTSTSKFTLTVTDNEGNTATCEFTILVK